MNSLASTSNNLEQQQQTTNRELFQCSTKSITSFNNQSMQSFHPANYPPIKHRLFPQYLHHIPQTSTLLTIPILEITEYEFPHFSMWFPRFRPNRYSIFCIFCFNLLISLTIKLIKDYCFCIYLYRFSIVFEWLKYNCEYDGASEPF